MNLTVTSRGPLRSSRKERLREFGRASAPCSCVVIACFMLAVCCAACFLTQRYMVGGGKREEEPICYLHYIHLAVGRLLISSCSLHKQDTSFYVDILCGPLPSVRACVVHTIHTLAFVAVDFISLADSPRENDSEIVRKNLQGLRRRSRIYSPPVANPVAATTWVLFSLMHVSRSDNRVSIYVSSCWLDANYPTALSLLLTSVVATSPEEHLVVALPGLNDGDLPTKQYAGHIPVVDGFHFYWLFESASADPSSDPLVIWLNGGPVRDETRSRDSFLFSGLFKGPYCCRCAVPYWADHIPFATPNSFPQSAGVWNGFLGDGCLGMEPSANLPVAFGAR